MIKLTRLVLDVLKPHQPNSYAFATRLAEVKPGLVVNLMVVEMDEHTHTIQLEIVGSDIPLDEIEDAINELGGSLHSIDEVQVENTTDDSSVGDA
ncbi:DUF211 domain-containing protein [Reinekea blandensis]|uniref:DUF211 domain-containing protein n=1 Tax=Reinekea blandensis MED297 TaxID=314283 RepID=A4BCW5_9GAMM|nr:DUF211 domain-containing protein [Reinekea blandensis]EAR10047.1 hypothetical protein MED297_08161 [Reinekea sp. MED297] [Reinekea blandensis MED297]